MEVIALGFVYYNPNPLRRDNAGDCTVRAITKALEDRGYDWELTYSQLCVYGMRYGDMPSANSVWGAFLLDNGFEEYSIIKKCRDCYTVNQFCKDHPDGIYVIGTDNHAVAVVQGDIWDTYNSGDMYPTYYFEKTKEENNNG